MKRSFGALFSLLYPVLILILLRLFAGHIPAGAQIAAKFYPVIVSAVFFTVFFKSLYAPQSFVEKLARLKNPDLPPKGVAYTRNVTKAWCFFLALNGLTAAGLALWASTELWALYTGVIAYILMGLIFGGEWLIRRRVQNAQS